MLKNRHFWPQGHSSVMKMCAWYSSCLQSLESVLLCTICAYSKHTLVFMQWWLVHRFENNSTGVCVTSGCVLKTVKTQYTLFPSTSQQAATRVLSSAGIVRTREMQVKWEEDCCVVTGGRLEVWHLLSASSPVSTYLKLVSHLSPVFFAVSWSSALVLPDQKTSLLQPLAKSSRRTQMTSRALLVAPSTAHCFLGASLKFGVEQCDT